MSGTRRNLLRGILGAAASTALAPNQLMKAASAMVPAPAPVAKAAAKALTPVEGNLLRRIIQQALDHQIGDAREYGVDTDDEGNYTLDDPDNEEAQGKVELLKDLEDLFHKVNTGKPLTADNRKELGDWFSRQLGMYDDAEQLFEELSAYEDGLGGSLEDLQSIAHKLGDGSEEVKRLVETNPMPQEEWEAYQKSREDWVPPGSSQLGNVGTPSVSLNAPTRGMLPAEASANPEAFKGVAMRDDDAQRSLPAPEDPLKSNGFHRKVLESDFEDPGAFPDWGDNHDLSDDHFDKLTRATFPDDDNSPHGVMKEWAQSSTSRAINDRLRRGKGGDLEDTHIRNIDSLFHQHAHEFDKPTTLYRAMPAKNLEAGNLGGKHLHDRGLLPLTTTPRRALEYFNDYGSNGPVALMRVKVSPGDKALFPDRHLHHLGQPAQGENEVLLPRGARLSVKSHTQSVLRNQETQDGRRPIHLLDAELIGHE